jgi:hypothetical protein
MEAEHVLQDRACPLAALHQERHALQTPNGMFGRDVAGQPCGFGINPWNAHESKARPMRVLEGQHALAEALLHAAVLDALLDKTMGPVAESARGHAEGRLLRRADAIASGATCSQGKKVRIEPGWPRLSPK